jgi:hypothetical protein
VQQHAGDERLTGGMQFFQNFGIVQRGWPKGPVIQPINIY